MHQSAQKSFEIFSKTYMDLIKNPHVVEIGSLDINGKIKSLINKNIKYTGIDMCAGPNVDIVLNDPYKFPLQDNSVDVIISISTFEHAEFFWLTYLEILRVLKPHGLLFMNVPSNGNFHQHDTDNWRFYPDSSLALKKWGIRNNFNPLVLEHFTTDHKGRDIWNDYVSVTIKNKEFSNKFPNRIIEKISNFRNGRTNKSKKIINYTKLPQDHDNWGWKIYYKFRKFLNKINSKY